MSEANKPRTSVIVLLVVSLVVIIDQATKQLALKLFDPLDPIVVIPKCFNLTLAFNKGAAFGMFGDLPDGTRQLVLAGAAVLAFIAIIYFLVRDYKYDPFGQAALSMILGGAIGNIIDRVVYGKVVDFIDWYYGSYHWPAFNIADSAICVGVAILILKKPRKKPETEAQEQV